MTITTTIKAGDKPQTINLSEGQSLTLKGYSGSSGVAYLLDQALGGTNSLKSWTIGSGTLPTIGGYAGSQQILITCTAGSIDASVGDAAVTALQLVNSGSGSKFLVNPDGSRIALSGVPALTKGRTLKRMSDLRNITLTNGAGMSSVATIDQQSPFGGPALKLVLTASAGSTRNHDVILSNINIAKFDGHVLVDLWVDDPLKITQFTTWIGSQNNGTLVNYNQYNRIVGQGGDKVGGHRPTEAGPFRTPVVSTFSFGIDTLQQVKFRTSVVAEQTTTIWIREISIPNPPDQAIIVMTNDDDMGPVWEQRAIPHYERNGIKATFAINTADITAGTGGTHITPEAVKRIVSGGHQVAPHCVNNYKLQTLNASGNGEDNGTGTSLGHIAYMDDLITSIGVLTGSCEVPFEHMSYHAWVQGGADTAAVEYARSEGIEIARNIGAPNEVNLYGFDMGNNIMYLKAFELGSGTTLAQLKSAVDLCVRYRGILVTMGHNYGDTSSNSTTWAESNLAALCDHIGAYIQQGLATSMRMMDLRNFLLQMGHLPRPQVNPKPVVRQIGRRLAADFNSTADQQVFLDPGQFVVTGVGFTKATRSMTTAVGGVYSGPSKGGTPIIAASQTYSGMVTSTDVVLAQVDSGAVSLKVSGSIYLSLTSSQGAAGSNVDVFVFGYPV